MKYPLASNFSYLFPNNCTLCGENIPGVDKSLCLPCQEQLPWLKNGCRYCSYPLSDSNLSGALCGQCQQTPPPFHSSHCLFRYDYPVDQLISRLKFNHQLMIGRLLGQLMAESLSVRRACEALPEAIIPMPLHRRRLRQRGFNQAYEIAFVCANRLNIPLLDNACRRIKDTPPQLALDAKARRRNLRQAFIIEKGIAHQSIAIVDDVMTTGSSMRELSRELIKAGAERIELWCIARTTIE
ncbi:MAG: ComF family protein [Pseudomonadales bacterium]|nr:ComF family protein [Pseudomonadales bacterium]